MTNALVNTDYEQGLRDLSVTDLTYVDNTLDASLDAGIPYYDEVLGSGSALELIVVQKKMVVIGIAKGFAIRALDSKKENVVQTPINEHIWLPEIQKKFKDYNEARPGSSLSKYPHNEFMTPARASRARELAITRHLRANDMRFCARSFVLGACNISWDLKEQAAITSPR